MWLHRCGISVLILTKLYNYCLAGFLGKTSKPKSPASLSWPQAKALACYSVGIVLANTCGLTQVADSLAELLGQKRQSVFQRLREWRNEAKAKKGEQREEVSVAACFAPLLAWILS